MKLQHSNILLQLSGPLQ